MDSTRRQEIPITDAHVHVGEDRDGSVVTEDDVLRLLDDCDIDRALIIPFDEKRSDGNFLEANRHNHEIAKRHPDRLIAGFRLDPKGDVKPSLDLAEQLEVPVIKLHPTAQHFKIYSDLVTELLDDMSVRRYSPLVYIHTDIIPVEGTDCHDLNCPRDVLELARRYPAHSFVVAHCGRWCEATENGIGTVDNIFIDTSIVPLFLINKSIAIVGHERVLYGSDYPYSHPGIELEKIFRLGLEEPVLKAILADNFARLVAR